MVCLWFCREKGRLKMTDYEKKQEYGRNGEKETVPDLRDMFAGMAITGLYAAGSGIGGIKETVETAYRIAEAMMEARKK